MADSDPFEQHRKLAQTNPRVAVGGAWEVLAKTVLQVANVSGENVQPLSTEVRKSLTKLETSVQYPEQLIRSIENLQESKGPKTRIRVGLF